MVWAFMFVDERVPENQPPLEMQYADVRYLTYGVRSIEEGAQLAKKLWDEQHCELVELCGGFGPEGAKRVIEVTKGEVRVGYVTKKFPPEI